MKKNMPLEGLRWSRDSGSALYDTPQTAVLGRAGEEADLKYRALKMVLPSDDPNIHYIEKHFSVCRDEKVIDDVRNHVAAYEDSVLKYNEMVRMAAYKDSIAKQLVKESDNIKRTINSSK